MQCPTTEVLSLVARLDPNSYDREVSTHLECCPACQAVLALLKSDKQVASDEPRVTSRHPGSASESDPCEATTDLDSNGRPVASTDYDQTGDYQQADFSQRRSPDQKTAADSTHAIEDPETKDLEPETQSALRASSRSRGSEEFREPTVLNSRFPFVRALGKGAFGSVYLARDMELGRLVAIKVAHKERIRDERDIEWFLEEAKSLASLDHPHVLPVFDVGRTEDGSCYLVTKYIEGTDLAGLVSLSPLQHAESARLIARIADGLDHAHRQGLIHRDVKPANILIGIDGHPYLADFGLALRDSDTNTRFGLAGTPEYMSPEQARGEGHRIDARSDIYSLGVVFYRLLTGRRPYEGSTIHELLEKVVHLDVTPPRELNPGLATELERICLKMLEKRAADRYQAAGDLVADLVDWETSGRIERDPAETAAVAKGLRRYDTGDADSFLSLLPGPRNREGLPESVAFWKRRIDATDSETFPVGLLIGSSGSGKSSLVVAGILPRLARHVEPIFVDMTRGRVESRLLAAIRSAYPNLAPEMGLRETLAFIRRSASSLGRRKTLIVLDQFEQCLALKTEQIELIDALRQCDGQRLQTLLIVRDDFAVSASRFLERLEVPLVQGHNFAIVDQFSIDHARSVLLAFGRSFGKIPPTPESPTVDHERFLDRAVEELAATGDISPVRLAVFSEMVRDKPWTPVSINEKGGVEGLGVAFLESLFGATSAHPRLRAMVGPARTLLRELLPPPGSAIRGNARSISELKAAVGSILEDREFDELVTLLDGEARLISLVGDEKEGESPEVASGYQLTHDYLVPSLRTWLSLKQRETARGRAELLLAERAAGWALDPSNRQLPSTWEMPLILGLTREDLWNGGERSMMRRAIRLHGTRLGVAVLAVLLVSIVGFLGWRSLDERRLDQEAAGLVARLVDSDTVQVPGVLVEIEPQRVRVDRLLDDTYRREPDGSRARRRAALGLQGSRPELAGFLADELRRPRLDLAEVLLIADALKPRAGQISDSLEASLDNPDEDPDRRFVASLTLSRINPASATLRRNSSFVANHLLARITVNPVEFGALAEAFMSIRPALVSPLLGIFRGANSETRGIAFNLLTRYAHDDPETLVALLVDCEPIRVGDLLPLLQPFGTVPSRLLERQLAEEPVEHWDDPRLDLPTAPADAAAALAGADGWVAPAFAFCQSLPLEELPAIAESLRAAGYRPIRIRPYADAIGTRVAVVWTRDGREWRIAIGLARDEVVPRLATQAGEGFVVDDLASFLVSNGESKAEHYAVVWVKAAPGEPERRASFGLGDEEYEEVRIKLRDQDFLGLTHHVLDLNGAALRSHATVWVKADREALLRSHRFDGSAGDYSGDIYLGGVQADVSLGISDHPRPLARRMQDQLDRAEAALKLNPKEPNERFNRGQAYFFLGQDDLALKDWDDLIREFPAWAWMWKYPRMILHARRGDLDKARADLHDYIEKSQDQGPITHRKNQGRIAYLKAYLAACEGDIGGAAASLVRVAEQHPGDSSFLHAASNGLAWIADLAARRKLADTGRYEELTIDLLEAAIKAGLKITPDLRDDPDYEPVCRNPRFLSLVGQGRLDDRYTAIWRALPGLESTELHGLSPADHAARCRELASNGYRPAAIAAFRPSLNQSTFSASVWHRPLVADSEILRVAGRRANAAVALIRLGLGASVWPRLVNRPDPTLATAILHKLAPGGVDPSSLAARLTREPDAGIRRVLILGIGLIPASRLGEELRIGLMPTLATMFADDPDPGIHSAVEWTLRRSFQVDVAAMARGLASAGPRDGFGWYVDRSDNTLLIAGPATFEMGMRPEESGLTTSVIETLHSRAIPRRFAMASKEVTNAQFSRFLAENPEAKYYPAKSYSPDPDGPASSISWPRAVAYCRWLTEKEGMGDEDQCYDAVDPTAEARAALPITLRQGYLARRGYRLPTEPEWECFARAGTKARFSYGWSNELLPAYSWYEANASDAKTRRQRTHSVGLLLPNSWGSFDMMGNAAEWTSNLMRTYPSAESLRLDVRREPPTNPGKPAIDREWLEQIVPEDYIVIRGGSFFGDAQDIRPAKRDFFPPTLFSPEVGFRVARTLPD